MSEKEEYLSPINSAERNTKGANYIDITLEKIIDGKKIIVVFYLELKEKVQEVLNFHIILQKILM